MSDDYQKISLTAKLAAYMRQFSDIPFAGDVAEYLHASEAFNGLLKGRDMTPADLHWYAPIFEARYKSVTAAVRRSGAPQVLELASGLSLRGLALARDPGLTYIESDLDDLNAAKAGLVATLRARYGLADYGNHHLMAVNALNALHLRSAVSGLQRERPLAIVAEGLLQYLSPVELRLLAYNIRLLLTEFGGVWITTDFSLKDEVGAVTEQQRKFRQIVAAVTDRPMYNNAFDSAVHLADFVKGAGFRAQSRRQVEDAGTLVSPGRLALPAAAVADSLSRLQVWTLTLDSAA